MKFSALRHKKTPEFASIKSFNDTGKFQLYTHELPDPRPEGLTIEMLKGYYDQHGLVIEDGNFDDLEIRQYEFFEIGTETLELYVVRSKDGKYLRSKGYSGYGESWVTDLKKAKVYTKKGPASAQVTWWANNYPDYGVPDLIPLTAIPGDPIDQKERVAKSQRKKELNETKWKLWNAQRAFDSANATLEKYKGGEAERLLKIKEKELKNLKDKIEDLEKK